MTDVAGEERAWLSDELARIDGELGVATRYPYPIAQSFGRIGEPVAGDPFHRAIFAGVVTTRYLAEILLADYRRHDDDLIGAPMDAGTLERLGSLPSAIRRPGGDGVWVGVIDNLLDAYRDHPQWLFVRELHGLRWEDQGEGRRPRRRPKREIDNAFRWFLAARNTYHHGLPLDGSLRRERFAGLLRALETMWRSLSVLADYPLVEVMSADGDLARVRVWMGRVLPAEEVERRIAGLNGKNAAARSGVALLNGQGHPLPIAPFALNHAHRTPPQAVADVLLYDQYRPEKARVVYLPGKPLVQEVVIGSPATELVATFLAETENALLRAGVGVPGASPAGDDRLKTADAWTQVRDGLRLLSRGPRAELRARHDAGTYLERAGAGEAFRALLASSERRFLVYAGDSGTGKTSLVAHLLDLVDAEGEWAPLVLGGAAESFPEDLAKAVRRQAAALPDGAGEPLTAALTLPDAPPGGRGILVFLDAINENLDGAAAVLKSVHRAATQEWRQPWIKFVLTCRVTAWRRAVSRLRPRPDPTLFHVAGERRLGDVHAVEVVGFEDEAERERAYEGYRAHHGVATPYAELGDDVRDLMRDPLAMGLLTRAHAGRAVPAAFGAQGLRRDFEDALLSQGTLEPRDGLLLDEVVSLLARADANRVTQDDLDSVEVRQPTLSKLYPRRRGFALPESVPLRDFFFDPSCNGSFRRLKEAGLLDEEWDDVAGGSVGFRFERFYDEHVGDWLVASAEAAGEAGGAPARAGVHAAWARRLHGQGGDYAWRASRHGLSAEIARDDVETLECLARSGDAAVKDALVAAQVHVAGRSADERARANRRLLELWQRRARPWAPPAGMSDAEPEKRRSTLVRTIAESADRLALPEPLVLLLADEDQETRIRAMRHVGAVFDRERRHSPRAGSDFLARVCEGLGKELHAGWAVGRKKRIVQSMFELTALILMDHVGDAAVRRLLWERWRDDVLLRYAFSRADEPVARRSMKGLLRRGGVTLGGGALLPIAERRVQQASPNVVTNYREFAAFFPDEEEVPLEPEDRAVLGRLLELTDRSAAFFDDTADGRTVRGDVRDTVEHALRLGDGLTSAVLEHVLSVHGPEDPQATRGWLADVFASLPEDGTRGPAGFRGPSGSRFDVMQGFYMACEGHLLLVEQGDIAPAPREQQLAWLNTLGEFSSALLELDRGRYGTRLAHARRARGAPQREVLAVLYGSYPMHWHAALHSRLHGDDENALFAGALERAASEGSVEKLRSLIGSVGVLRANIRHFRGMLGPLADVWRAGWPSLAAVVPREWKCACRQLDVEPALGRKPSCDLEHYLIANLGQLRAVDRDIVEWFLDEIDAASDMRLEVERAQRPLDLGDVFARADFAIMRVLRDVPHMRRWIVDGYAKAATSGSIRDWLRWCMRDAVTKVEEAIGEAETPRP